MDLDEVFESGNYVQAREKVDEKDILELLQSKYYNLRELEGNNNYCSPQRKSLPAKLHNIDGKNSKMLRKEMHRSREVKNVKIRKSKNENSIENSSKHSLNNEAFLEFDVVDHLPQLSPNEENMMEFVELTFCDSSEERIKLSSSCSNSSQAVMFEDDAVEFSTFPVEKTVNISFDERNSRKDTKSSLPKSVSVKEAMLSSPRESETKDNMKSRFSPFKKLFDPITKSRSLRSQFPIETVSANNSPSSRRHRSFRKSLLNDFSKTTDKMDYDTNFKEKEQICVSTYSPAHLQATLNSEFKHGSLSYEFSINDHEDVIVAKAWRTDSAFNWMYTFHGSNKSRDSCSGKQTPIIGQMQVSCYLCSEVNDAGSLESSTLTEFVLFDIAQARRSLCAEDDSKSTSNSDPLSNSYPWANSDLHPNLEVASVVIQIPFDSKKVVNEEELDENITFECMNSANVKAMIPSGTHGLPVDNEGSPSSLLDRWRYGGGCDCGGWDMACPIDVLQKPSLTDVIKNLVNDSHQMMLFVQGRREKVPALSIISNGKGQYSVQFHAQLSSLQAFSICISVLHSSESFSALGQQKTQRLYSNSLKLILEEEVKHLLESVAEAEKNSSEKKTKQQKSFMLDSPFSPMGRV